MVARSRADRRTPSDSLAFDAYQGNALRKLEGEQREFRVFLDRLHRARDQAEFDAFTAKRAK